MALQGSPNLNFVTQHQHGCPDFLPSPSAVTTADFLTAACFNLQHLVYPHKKLHGRIFPNEYTVEACSYREPLEMMINELYKSYATTQYQAGSIG